MTIKDKKGISSKEVCIFLVLVMHEGGVKPGCGSAGLWHLPRDKLVPQLPQPRGVIMLAMFIVFSFSSIQAVRFHTNCLFYHVISLLLIMI